ncbi:hypothetical protein C1646_670389 [Rhizophagus diaphanus]|nr:hypothetical protein C1646_670389 [Rhizophagus diaphanus] [Rhizophagus sp. MUCL 43196]
MTNFSDIISEEGKRWACHTKLMSSFLTNDYAPSGYGVGDYNHRYFYIAHDERCYCISGYARDHMADYLFQKVMGFMVEKACLATIYMNGLEADEKSIEEINFSKNEGLGTFYLPRLWNQKSIDGLITLYKTKSGKDILYITPIQIALSKETHSDSEATFFSGIWPKLNLKLLDKLKVEVIFIWVTRENDVNYFVEANEKRLRGKLIEINPQYKVVVKAFKSINIELENILSNL